MLRDIAGRYQLQKKLGAGAWATVYEAVDTGAIGRRVAIKVFRLPPLDEGASAADEHARFRQGARAAGRLSHPNVVSVFDYGEDAEVAWIVMEMVEGDTLKALLDRDGRMPAPAAVALMAQILDALAYTHSRGVVHRDIKPENILLTRDRVVKIADFGVARIENSSMTHVGTVLGSPAYMAPEQFLGDAVDHRADIWAAGVVLYQMLTGERPFEGGVASVMQKALYAEPVSPSLTEAAAPAQYDAVIARALAKRPDDRFPSAAEFTRALRVAAAAAPGAARPRPRPDPATRVSPRPPARRRGARAGSSGKRAPNRRTWVAATVAGGFLLPAGVAGLLVLTSPPSRPGPKDAAPSADVPHLADPPRKEFRLSEAPPPPGPALSAGGLASEAPQPAAATLAVSPPVATAPPDTPPTRVAGLAGPPPVPPPGAPPRQTALSRQEIDAAALAAASAITCGVVVPVALDSGVSLTGVARRGEAAGAEAALTAMGIPGSDARLSVEAFDGPYCDVLSRVRGIASAGGTPRLTLDSPDPLPGGELLRFRVQTPDWPAHLHVSYLMTTGTVGHLFSTASRQPPRSSLALADPTWEATEPYGTELLLVVASERPLFGGQKRRKVETLDQFAADLAPALSAVQDRGRRASAQVVAVRTVAPRQGVP